jgi:hypothetical protein
VGAHLVATAGRDVEVRWRREGHVEVDFVLGSRDRVLAIEVGSGRRKSSLPRLEAFVRRFDGARTLLVEARGLRKPRAGIAPRSPSTVTRVEPG